MRRERPSPSEAERTAVVGVLRAGLVLAAALMAVGLALAARDDLRSQAVFPAGVGPALLEGRAEGFLAAGVLVLLLTQAVPPVTLAVRFAREGERGFAVVAAAVALVLAAGAAVGRS